ncbi:MAG: hypothetical protein ACI9BO_001142 [Zhongshania sp.]|jgi:hypothetical protein
MEDDRTWLAAILFLDIVGYSKLSVEQQVQVKRHFLQFVNDRTSELSSAESVKLDTGDGLAYCFLGDPVKMYAVSHSLRDDFSTIADNFPLRYEVRMGLNVGPIKLVAGVNGERNCLGAGINDAQRVMDFSDPNQLLISKTYYDMISKVSNYCAQCFESIGLKYDKHNFEHAVYQLTKDRFQADAISDIRSEPQKAQVAIEIDSDTEQHLLKNLRSCIGSGKAAEIYEVARFQATTVKELCEIFSTSIEDSEDRYEFERFTKSYGYSGY